MHCFRNLLRRVKRCLMLALNTGYDAWRYHQYSAKSGLPSRDEHLPAQLITQYHALEKGLALSETRPGFGQDHLRELFRLLAEWRRRKLPENHLAFQGAVATLAEYIRFHRCRQHPVVDLEANFEAYESCLARPDVGGAISVRRESIRQSASAGFEALALNRHSVRQFASDPVDPHLIRHAVRIAQRTPSACNRQSSRVYAFWDPEKKRAVLECQSGNRGFREDIALVLIVTSDLGAFCDPKERYQCFVDGGMFAMSLLYALHYVGLGACALNWSVTMDQDRALRQVASVRPSENVVMLIAAGHLREEFRVARSERKPLDEVLMVIP